MTPVAQKTDKPPKKGSLVCETHLGENKKDRIPGQRTGPGVSLTAKCAPATVTVPVPSQPNGTDVWAPPKKQWAANSHIIKLWLLYGLYSLVRW